MVKGRQGERVSDVCFKLIEAIDLIEGVNTKEDVSWYCGKKIAYIYKAKVKKNGTHYAASGGRLHGPMVTVELSAPSSSQTYPQSPWVLGLEFSCILATSEIGWKCSFTVRQPQKIRTLAAQQRYSVGYPPNSTVTVGSHFSWPLHFQELSVNYRTSLSPWLSPDATAGELNVIPFHPRARISAISVGNNLIESHPDAVDDLLPAISNVDSSLRDLGIHHISVSTTFSFVSVMTGAFQPSSATFEEPLSRTLILPLLEFLKATNSSFMVNIYPYNLYRLRWEIPLGFALFQNASFMYRDDLTTGARYWNLFDMMVDSVVAAMAVAGHEDVPIVVAETGWPSSSQDRTEIDANGAYAEMYIKGLIKHLRSAAGTPLRREGVAEAYIYELVDKEVKHGGVCGRSWGILYPNMTRKYEYRLEFSWAYRLGHWGDMVVGLLLVMVGSLTWVI
ncbi:hypothetical protein SAY86_007586 [Trapa natans]|uniref:glucan endo-1,3-beta-D-glucosidase n=1 Tax=Trapa natans TaxID=22666 RepID=A0AAN7QY08_TRANT|nr:hypothetical protein SAY86_007586 [Trapa natans]